MNVVMRKFLVLIFCAMFVFVGCASAGGATKRADGLVEKVDPVEGYQLVTTPYFWDGNSPVNFAIATYRGDLKQHLLVNVHEIRTHRHAGSLIMSATLYDKTNPDKQISWRFDPLKTNLGGSNWIKSNNEEIALATVPTIKEILQGKPYVRIYYTGEGYTEQSVYALIRTKALAVLDLIK